MLTYNRDVYKKILAPSGICLFPAPTEGNKYIVPHGYEQVWEMLFPSSLKNRMQVKYLTAFNQGKNDDSNGEGRRDAAKNMLKSHTNSVYSDFRDHISKMITDNAAINVYIERYGKKLENICVYPKYLSEFIIDNESEVEERKREVLHNIGGQIISLSDQIMDDTRISNSFKQFIIEKGDSEPVVSLEILLILSLFSRTDNDFLFFEYLEAYYCKNRINPKSYLKEEKLPSVLTNSFEFNASRDSVLFREEEVLTIINALMNENKKSVLLSGMGGCGKTSIARLVYSELKNRYDCHGWVNFTGDLRESMISSINIKKEEKSDEDNLDEKWINIVNAFRENSQKKLLVIDNVDYIDNIQNPSFDRDLMSLSTWDNLNVLITTRLPHIDGFNNVLKVENIGNEQNNDNCVQLFYHYNQEARKQGDSNKAVVSKLCNLVDNNAMVIELLARASIYEDLEEFYAKFSKGGFSTVDDVPIKTFHDYNIIRTDDKNPDYYDIGNETAISQLIKLFNMKFRSDTERLLLWDLHCLPEGEHVTKQELTDWLGYSLKDIDSLREEGWIKYENGFFIHSLIRQTIACQDSEWEKYWDDGMKRRYSMELSTDLISRLLGKTLFSEKDKFSERVRLLMFADRLTCGGKPLDADVLLYIADNARIAGERRLGLQYYKAAYEKIHNTQGSQVSKDSIDDCWKAAYYYGYMLSFSKAGYEEGEKLIRESMEITKDCLVESPPNYGHIVFLAASYDHLGYILSNRAGNRIDLISEADTYLQLAVSIRKLLCDNYPDNVKYLHDYAWSLDNFGSLYANININNIDFAETGRDRDIDVLSADEIIQKKIDSEWYFIEARRIRKLLAYARGNKDSAEVAWTCRNYAKLILNRPERFEKVKALLNEALAIYYRLEKRAPGQHAGSEAQTYLTYGRFLSQFPEFYQEAIGYYEKALELNVTLDGYYPGDYKQEISIIQDELTQFKSSL